MLHDGWSRTRDGVVRDRALTNGLAVADAVARAAQRLANHTSTHGRSAPAVPPPLVQAAGELQRASIRLRAEQREQTRGLVHVMLTSGTGTLRTITVDPSRHEVLLLVETLLLRATVTRAGQALCLQSAQRRGGTTLDGAQFLDGDRVLLAFGARDDALPLVVETLTRVHG